MANNDNKSTWPGWKTVRLIGRGSFGEVYEIERDVYGHKEKAAMKVISIPQNDSDIEELYDSGYDEESITATFKEHLESIVSEYTLMREMNGASNVVNCDDFRVVPHEDGVGWDIQIRMELLKPLTRALDSNPSDEQVIRIAKDMCNALILCRKHGIIHRDIKPQNIFVSKNGDYKLGDFGIAKTIEKTTGGTKIGTYKYMAPEVYKSEPYNHTADIYSLGLVLHWLLNERRAPFLPLPPAPAGAALESEAREKRFSGEQIPLPAHGSAELKRIVLKACAYEPKERYQSADEMLRDLEALSGKAGDRAPETLVGPPADPEEETDGGTFGAFGAAAAQQEERETEEEDEGTGSVTVGAFGRKDEPPAPPPKPRKWPVVLGVVGSVLALLLIAFFTIHSWNPATCTEPETCKICGKTRGEALGHRYTEATCLEAAICTVCGDVSTGATGHDWGEPEYTWSADNSHVTAKRVCKNDPTHVETENVKTSSEVTAAASCTENGTTTYTAAFTNSAFGTQTKAAGDIAAIGHDWGEPSYTWSADNSNVTAKRVCKNDPTHVESENVKTTAKVTTAATCTAKGQTTYTAAFKNSAFAPQTKTAEDIPAKGHDWGEATYTWSADNSSVTAKRVCRHDPTHVESENVKTSSRITTAATCTTKGKTTYTASFGKSAFPTQTKTVDIPAKGHNWGSVTYTWSADNSSVTAKRTCLNDSSHVETETVRTTSRVTTDATCTTKGKTTYTASFGNGVFSTQTKTVDISAKGHDWKAATYDDPKTCRVCGKTEGDPKGYRRNVDYHWGDRLQLHGYSYGSSIELESPAKNCLLVKFTIELFDISGNPFGSWFFYGRDQNGKWQNIGKFELLKENKDKPCTYTISLDGKVTYSAFYAAPVYDNGWSMSYTWDIDVQEYVG